jgi:hypothetical protein
MFFLFDILSHSTLCPIRPLIFSTLCLFGILSHSTFCPFDILYHSTFCHSALCPIRRFVVRLYLMYSTTVPCRVSGDVRLAPPPRGFTEDQTVTVISITPQEPGSSGGGLRPPPDRRPLTAWAEEPEDGGLQDDGRGGGSRTPDQLFGPGLHGGEKEEVDSQRSGPPGSGGWRRLANQRIATNGSLTGTVHLHTYIAGHKMYLFI